MVLSGTHPTQWPGREEKRSLMPDGLRNPNKSSKKWQLYTVGTHSLRVIFSLRPTPILIYFNYVQLCVSVFGNIHVWAVPSEARRVGSGVTGGFQLTMLMLGTEAAAPCS